jgi:hypothetical protein
VRIKAKQTQTYPKGLPDAEFTIPTHDPMVVVVLVGLFQKLLLQPRISHS